MTSQYIEAKIRSEPKKCARGGTVMDGDHPPQSAREVAMIVVFAALAEQQFFLSTPLFLQGSVRTGCLLGAILQVGEPFFPPLSVASCALGGEQRRLARAGATTRSCPSCIIQAPPHPRRTCRLVQPVRHRLRRLSAYGPSRRRRIARARLCLVRGPRRM